jgi:hypothetical protein
VNIPLKVQGWINGKLIHVYVQNSHAESIRHAGKVSKTIWGYLSQLFEVARQEQGAPGEEDRAAS